MSQSLRIGQLTAFLLTEALDPQHSEICPDRDSGGVRILAKFVSGKEFDFVITGTDRILAIREIWQVNLKDTLAPTSAFRDLFRLIPGERYTVLAESEMGLGVSALRFTLIEVQVGKFAQHTDCVTLKFKSRGTKSISGHRFYGNHSFAVYAGWIHIDTNPLGPASDEGGFSCRKSKYLSFDERYMTDAIASAGVQPLCSRVLPRNKGDRP